MNERNLVEGVRGLLLAKISRKSFVRDPEFCSVEAVENLLRVQEHILSGIIEDYRESLGKDFVDIKVLMDEVALEFQGIIDSVEEGRVVH